MPISAESPLHRDLSDWVLTKILNGIKNGELQPGEHLVERTIATQLGVSRAPVRDAIHKLESLGVVERKHPRGIYVKTWGGKDVVEIIQLLDALILLSIELSWGLIGPTEIKELEDIIDQTKEIAKAGSPSLEDQISLQRSFHIVIAKASGNSRLVEQIKRLSIALEVYEEQFLSTIGSNFSFTHHENLLEALKTGDRDQVLVCVRRHAQESQALLASMVGMKDKSEGPD